MSYCVIIQRHWVIQNTVEIGTSLQCLQYSGPIKHENVSPLITIKEFI